MGDIIVTSTQMELPVQGVLIESNKYGDGDTKIEYITGPVPALLAPSKVSQRPKTRFRALMDSLVIPAQCTDLPSETEDDSGLIQGRPARSGKGTARA